jgi:hypothetical protein
MYCGNCRKREFKTGDSPRGKSGWHVQCRAAEDLECMTRLRTSPEQPRKARELLVPSFPQDKLLERPVLEMVHTVHAPDE